MIKTSSRGDYGETIGEITVQDPPWFVFEQVNWAGFTPQGSYYTILSTILHEIAPGIFVGSLCPCTPTEVPRRPDDEVPEVPELPEPPEPPSPPQSVPLFRIRNISNSNAGACTVQFRLLTETGAIITQKSFLTPVIQPNSSYDFGVVQPIVSVFTEIPFISMDSKPDVLERLRELTNNFNFDEWNNQYRFFEARLITPQGVVSDSVSGPAMFINCLIGDIVESFRTISVRRSVVDLRDIIPSITFKGVLLHEEGALHPIVGVVEVVNPINNTVVYRVSRFRRPSELGITAQNQYVEFDMHEILPQRIDLTRLSQGVYRIRILYYM